MSLITHPNGTQFINFDVPEFDGTVHGFFTRKGGVSQDHFSSLNLGGSIGDDPEHVRENKRRVLAAVERDVNSLYEVWQVHGNDIVCTDSPLNPNSTRSRADGIFTANPDVTLLMRFADCVPILFFDPIKRIVGIVHAGWQGTANRIVEKAVEVARNQYGCDAKNLVAGIGPSIGPDHYQIGDVVIERITRNLKGFESEVLINRNNQVALDLWKANNILLRNSGVHKIFNIGVCTACDTTMWFSHRAEQGKTGRFAGIIGLKK